MSKQKTQDRKPKTGLVEKGKNWGGKREGAGAPKKWDNEETESVTYRLPKSVTDKIDRVANEEDITRTEALVLLVDPALYKRTNPVVLQVAPGPQREEVVITEI